MSFSRPTLKDVAKLSGVSEISVSRVMRNAPNTSSRLREKVESAALQLHYSPNKVAGALASNTTDIIGVVLPSLRSNEYVEILSGIETVLRRSKYRMMLGVSDFSQQREIKIVSDLLSWRPSGVIMVGSDHSTDTYQLLERSVASLVEILNPKKTKEGLGVDFKFKSALERLASHWCRQGYKNIAYVEAADEQQFTKNLPNKLATELKLINASITRHIKIAKASSTALGVQCCHDILNDSPDIDAIFLSGYCFAEESSFYLTEKLPDRIGLGCIGYDYPDKASAFDQIILPLEEVGKSSAKLLLANERNDKSVLKKQVSLAAEFSPATLP